MNWETRRRRLTTQIAKLVNENDDRYAFERKLKKTLNAEWVGEGAARTVYSIHGGLVVKVENYTDQNETEFNTYTYHPKLLPQIYAYLLGKRGWDSGVPEYSVIVARKARVIRRVPKKGSRWYQRYRRLCRVFEDVFPCNVGVIGKRLVLIDGGCGEGYTDYYTGCDCW